MAMYYFNLNDHDTVVDIDGTDLRPRRGPHPCDRRGARAYVQRRGHPDAKLVGLDHVSAGRAWYRIVFAHHVGFRRWESRRINPDRSVPSVEVAPLIAFLKQAEPGGVRAAQS